jgi:hypothetical protein
MTEKPKQKQRSRYPVASFDPRMIETLLKAARGETVKFTFPSLKAARTFQTRLHTLRSRMKAEDDPRYDICCRAKTSLRNADGSGFVSGQSNAGPRQLWVVPRDIEYDELFKTAEIEAPTDIVLERDPLDDIPDGPYGSQEVKK